MPESGENLQPSEGGRQEGIPPLTDIALAYRGIRNHNANNTGLSALLMNRLDAFNAEERDGTPKNDTLDQKEFERDANAGLLDLTSNDLFTRIGLKIGRFGTQTGVEEIARQYETTGRSQLVPTVDNVELYTKFLSTLSPDDAKDNSDNTEDVAVLLQDVVDTLQRTLVLGFQPPQDAILYADDRQTLQDKGLEALRTFTMLDSSYKDSLHLRDEASNQRFLEARKSRIGSEYERRVGRFINNYRILENAEKYWGMNLLPEYMEGHSYLIPPDGGSYSPAEWHTAAIFKKDPNWERIQWREALSFIKRMDSDERTRTLGQYVRDNLLASITEAMNRITYDPRNQKIELDNIRKFLTGEQHDQAQLDRYINIPE